jgi:hypothetical protein
MKKTLILLAFILTYVYSKGQRKEEGFNIDWPGEYEWKIIKQENDNGKQLTMIIPGKETAATAPILGSMVTYSGLKYVNLDKLVAHYKAGIDVGTTLTILERNEKKKGSWVIFKVETPKTDKYPEPESDLYFIMQGEYALYENHVAIKKPSLDAQFIDIWTKIFKTARLTME